MKTKLYKEIAVAVDAWKRCKETGNSEWEMRWDDRLNACEQLLPSGSGFDCGTKIDREASSSSKIVLTTEYHHMDGESGMYDGWTSHTITVKPSFSSGFSLAISGRDRNQFKEYAYQCFDYELGQTIEVSADNSVKVIHEEPAVKATYNNLKQALSEALKDVSVLSGDVMGSSGQSWQDVAKTASEKFKTFASLLEQASQGNHEAFIVFPSPSELIEGEAN